MATSENKTPSLATKLAKIASELGAIKKDGQNKQQNYNFIEYAAVAGKMRDLLAKYQVIILPEVTSYEKEPASNGKGCHYLLKMTFMIINGEKPEEFYIKNWLSESADYGDKGVNKAETAGTKYFLMRLFQISEKGDDPDADSPEVDTQNKTGFDFKEYDKKIERATTADEVRKIYASIPNQYQRYFVKACEKQVARIEDASGN